MIEIICECGINHNGDMAIAAEMIKVAKDCGADMAKFQIYVPERVLDLDNPIIQEHWDTIKAAELSFEQVCDLKNLCDAAEIEFLASVFHPDRVEWTEKIGMKRYKIASRSMYDEVLAKAIIATRKPVIVSYGYYDGYNEAAIYARADVSTLYCISEYPTSLDKLRIIYYDNKGSIFLNDWSGFSDHTIGITASIVAMSLGARIIEKHFTLDRNLPGPDQVCSIETDELRQMCSIRDDIEEILYTE